MGRIIFLLLFPVYSFAQMQFIPGVTGRTSASDDYVIVNNTVKGTDGYEHSYIGSWNDFTAAGHYNGDATYSSIANDSVIFRFNGTKAELFFEEKNTLGEANISLDGGAYTEIDLYSATNTQQVLKYTTGTISQSVHTLVIKVLHTKHASSSNYYVVYDYAKVYSPLPVPIPPEPDSFDWYVETTGDNGDPCTLAEPCLTLDYVLDNIAQDGDVVHVGIGTFVEDDHLTPQHGVSIVGSGINQTTIKLNTSLNYTFVPFDYGDDDYLFQYISGSGNQYLSDLTIEGNSRGTHGGIYLSGVDSVKFERISIENFGFTGIWLKDTEADTVKDVNVSNSSYSGTFSSGAIMIGGSTVDDVYFNTISSDELTVGAVRGYNFKVMGPSPTSPTIDNIQLIDFVGTTSVGSNFGGGTPNIGIEMHNTTMTDVLIQGGSTNASMSLIRVSGSSNPSTHAVTVDGHNVIIPSGGGANIELSFHNATIRNCYLKGGRFGGIWNTDTSGPSADGWLIYNNVFEDIYTSGGQASSLRCEWFGFLNSEIYNNTMFWASGTNNGRALMTMNGATSTGILFKNNVVIDEGNTTVFVQNAGGSTTSSTFSYNQFYGLPEGTVSGVTYSNNLTTDPEINATGNRPDPYYRPSSSGSPLFESGTDVGLPFNGAAPTRGAYEILE